MEDFRKIEEMDPSRREVLAPWIWLARSRLGEREAAARDVRKILPFVFELNDVDRIFRYLLAELPEEKFLQSSDTEQELVQAWIHEASFFVASVRLLNGDKAKAREFFKKCLEAGPKGKTPTPDDPYLLVAKAELKALEAER